MDRIERNLNRILERIQSAVEKSGRRKEEVSLVAVTKTRPMEDIAALKKLGIRRIGESRVQELIQKYLLVKNDFEVHFIGHLQTNKVRQAVEMAHTIHSVDSLKIASAISTECGKLNKRMDVLIQVNTSSEPQKSGIEPDQLAGLMTEMAQMANLRVTGLMTMAMISEDTEKIRSCFRLLKELLVKTQQGGYDPVVFNHLSMGMTDDFEIAIEEGATLLRIGSALFEKDN